MGRISTVQDKLIALLNADAFFIDNSDPDNPVVKVPIVSKKQGDIESKLNEQLLNLGVGLVVILRRARLLETGVPTLSLNCQFALTAVANPTLKKVDAPLAYDIVEAAAPLLHWQFNGIGTGDQTQTSRFEVDVNAIAPLPPNPRQPFLDIQVLLINTTIDLA